MKMEMSGAKRFQDCGIGGAGANKRGHPASIMKNLRPLVDLAAVVVLAICVYTFLLGNEVFDGKFKNDPFGWYFLAKGIFCSVSLALSVRVLDVLRDRLPAKH